MNVDEAMKSLAETQRDINRRLHHLETLETQANHSHGLLHNHPVVALGDAAGQSIAVGGTVIVFDTEIIRDSAYYTWSNPSGVVTIVEDGVYRITVQTTFTTSDASWNGLFLVGQVDGGGGYGNIPGLLGYTTVHSTGVIVASVHMSTIDAFSAGDLIKMAAARSSGVGTNFSVAAGTSALTIERVPGT